MNKCNKTNLVTNGIKAKRDKKTKDSLVMLPQSRNKTPTVVFQPFGRFHNRVLPFYRKHNSEV